MKTKTSRTSRGKIAERIVMNELASRDINVTDLNKDGFAPNADLIASVEGRLFPIQVKGAKVKPKQNWWLQFGGCTPANFSGEEPVFNSKIDNFKVSLVALVAIKSPRNYRCFMMPVWFAEKLAQEAIDADFRKPKKDGSQKKLHLIWIWAESGKSKRNDSPNLDRLRKKLLKYEVVDDREIVALRMHRPNR
ncbi:MAG: hypothetical protein SFV21_15430 [Rhodospirillaceae bacterium]|nr:hypothetical protein [Rhodospirillaceae bacterium]